MLEQSPIAVAGAPSFADDPVALHAVVEHVLGPPAMLATERSACGSRTGASARRSSATIAGPGSTDGLLVGGIRTCRTNSHPQRRFPAQVG
ncbi:MAG: hypothetical protein ACR2KK_10165 [Acidimicrobiales bacterium]